MRSWILAIMIVLLPVRGWMGDAMAFSMMGIGLQNYPVTAAVMPCHETLPAAEPGSSAAKTPDVQHGSVSHPGQAHTSCDVCNGPALHTASTLPPLLQHVQTPLQPVSETFASAWPQRGIKPPIS